MPCPLRKDGADISESNYQLSQSVSSSAALCKWLVKASVRAAPQAVISLASRGRIL